METSLEDTFLGMFENLSHEEQQLVIARLDSTSHKLKEPKASKTFAAEGPKINNLLIYFTGLLESNMPEESKHTSRSDEPPKSKWL